MEEVYELFVVHKWSRFFCKAVVRNFIHPRLKKKKEGKERFWNVARLLGFPTGTLSVTFHHHQYCTVKTDFWYVVMNKQ